MRQYRHHDVQQLGSDYLLRSNPRTRIIFAVIGLQCVGAQLRLSGFSQLSISFLHARFRDAQYHSDGAVLLPTLNISLR